MAMASTPAHFETPDSNNPTPTSEQETFSPSNIFTLRELIFQGVRQYPGAEARDSPLDCLPASLQELLLLTVDPDAFASLSLVSRYWRQKSAFAGLYAFHLAHVTASDDEEHQEKWLEYRNGELPHLRHLFAKESKRRLFAAYRPTTNTIRYIGQRASTPVPDPLKGFAFSFSQDSTKVTACDALRMYLIDLSMPIPQVTSGFNLHKRPFAAAVANDGRFIVLTWDEAKLAVCTLEGTPSIIHVIYLDESPTALALSPDGSLLAAAHQSNIELIPLGPDGTAHQSLPRRKVPSECVTHLHFADNASLLVGTTVRIGTRWETARSVTIQCLRDSQDDLNSAETWLSMISLSCTCSRATHASAIPGKEKLLLAYNPPVERFGIGNDQTGKFTDPLFLAKQKFVRRSAGLPCMTSDASLVAVPFSRCGVHVVGLTFAKVNPDGSRKIPAKIDDQMLANGTHYKDRYYVSKQSAGQWFPLSDEGLTARWLPSSAVQRMVVLGSKKLPFQQPDEELFVLHYYDFEFSPSAGDSKERTVKLRSSELESLGLPRPIWQMELRRDLDPSPSPPPSEAEVEIPTEQPVEVKSAPALTPSNPHEMRATPSPDQMASLHRRQTSGSISSLRSDNSGAPRAALGAQRRTTNSISPWSSTLMLNTVDEGEAGPAVRTQVRQTSAHFEGSPGPSRPLSMQANGSTVMRDSTPPNQRNNEASNATQSSSGAAETGSRRFSTLLRNRNKGDDRRRSLLPDLLRKDCGEGEERRRSMLPEMLRKDRDGDDDRPQSTALDNHLAGGTPQGEMSSGTVNNRNSMKSTWKGRIGSWRAKLIQHWKEI